MALPLNQLSNTPVVTAFLSPDDRVRASLLVDYELGGVAYGDPSQGLQVQVWEARVSGSTIQTRPESGGAWTDVVTVSGAITEIALAFDQNMRATVAFVEGGVAKMYWFDAALPGYTTTTFAGAASPVVTMDDKRPLEVGLNDVLLFYLRGGRVYHRRQRDRYGVEYDLAAVPAGATRFRRWGFTVGLRIQLEFDVLDSGASMSSSGLGVPTVEGDPSEPLFGDAYPDLITDRLYVVSDTDIVPMFESGARPSTWRSKVEANRAHPAYSWLRVNAEGEVIVRLYRDGTLFHTVTVPDRNPVRIPPGRARHWEIQIDASVKVHSVALASSAEELRALATTQQV